MGWNRCSSWSCCILLEAWLSWDIFEESCCKWILSWYHIECILIFEFFQIGFWQRAERLWWIFVYHSLFYLDFLEPILCSLGSCCERGCLLNSLFPLDTPYYHCWWLLLSVVSIKGSLFLYYVYGWWELNFWLLSGEGWLSIHRWPESLQVISTYRKNNLLSCLFSIGNCIDD